MIISIVQGNNEITMKCKTLYFDSENGTIDITINANELYGVSDEKRSTKETN